MGVFSPPHPIPVERSYLEWRSWRIDGESGRFINNICLLEIHHFEVRKMNTEVLRSIEALLSGEPDEKVRLLPVGTVNQLYCGVTERILCASSQLARISTSEDQSQVIDYLKNLSEARELLANGGEIVYEWTAWKLVRDVHRLNKDFLSPQNAKDLWDYLNFNVDAKRNAKYHFYKPSGEYNKEYSRVKDLLKDQLSACPVTSDGLPFIDEWFLSIDRRRKGIKRGMALIYSHLVDIGAIQKYPADYISMSGNVEDLAYSLSKLGKRGYFE